MKNRAVCFTVIGIFIAFLHMQCYIFSNEAVAAIPKKARITFLEIGSVNCAPCKMMQPVMKEIEKKYDGKVVVVFYDISRTMGSLVAEKYGVRMIPTQVFLDDKGKEFFRHTGFYPAGEISKIIDKKLGKNAGNI